MVARLGADEFSIILGGAATDPAVAEAFAARLLRAVATPITRGRKTQVWDAKVEDGDGRVVATGRVRLLVLEKEEALAGQQVRGPLHPPA